MKIIQIIQLIRELKDRHIKSLNMINNNLDNNHKYNK